MSNKKWEPETDKADWAAFEKRYTSGLMARVDEYRKDRGLTVEALCRRLDDLGWPVSVSTMNGMLGAKRQSVSFPEVLLLARALEVSPAVLLLPIAANGAVDLFPGVTTDALQALSYISGRMVVDVQVLEWTEDDESTEIALSLDPLHVLYQHQALTDWLDTLERRMRGRRSDLQRFVETGEWVEFRDGALGDGLGSEIGFVRQIYVLSNLQSLRDLRQGMSSRGARLPPISTSVNAAMQEPKRDNMAYAWAEALTRA